MCAKYLSDLNQTFTPYTPGTPITILILKTDIALPFNKQSDGGARHVSVHPGHRHPLWGGGGSLHGFLHALHALIHIIVDKNHVKEVSVRG